MTGIILARLGVATGVLGFAWLAYEWRQLTKSLGPLQSGDWGEGAWGDVPNIPFHSPSVIQGGQQDQGA
jgi:hypothetical protein